MTFVMLLARYEINIGSEILQLMHVAQLRAGILHFCLVLMVSIVVM